VTCSLLVIQAVSVGADACLIGVRLAGYRLVGAVRQRSEERKKEGATHAPARCVSGLGLMAFLGHSKHARRPELDL
jgi:hypothetical protein